MEGLTRKMWYKENVGLLGVLLPAWSVVEV